MSAGGALCECYKQGMLEARFTDKNKLGRLELVFDVMSFVQQLTRASGLAEFPTVPHSVEAALHEESARSLKRSASFCRLSAAEVRHRLA